MQIRSADAVDDELGQDETQIDPTSGADGRSTPSGLLGVAPLGGDLNRLEPEAPADDRRRGIADLRRHTAQGMVINGVYQTGLVAISALRGVVVAAFLTRSDYGIWGLIGVTLWTAVGLKAVFGASDKYVQQSEENQEHAFQRAFTIELIFAAAIAPVAAAVVVAFALLSGHTAVLAPGLTLLLMLPSTALQFPLAIFYRRMNYRRQRTLSAIEPVGGAVVMVVLAILGAGYWSFVIGALAGSWAGAFVAMRASPFSLRLRYDRGTLGQYVRFSAPLLVGGLATLGLFQAITLLGAGIIGLAGLGTFTLVGNLVQFTDQADAIITATLYPAVCAVRDRVTVLTEIFIKSNRLSLMWAVPFGVGMTLFGADLVQFAIGRHWLPAIPLLEIMGIVTAVEHVGYNWSAFLKARGITWPVAASGLLVSATTIGAGVPLMRSHGAVGLGWGFAIGEVVALGTRGVALIYFFDRVSILSHLARSFAPTAIAAAPVLALRAFTGSDPNLAAALGVFALYVAVTIGATVALERPLLNEAASYLIGRRRQPARAGKGRSDPIALAPAMPD